MEKVFDSYRIYGKMFFDYEEMVVIFLDGVPVRGLDANEGDTRGGI
mgnify:CR=1 FL=1